MLYLYNVGERVTNNQFDPLTISIMENLEITSTNIRQAQNIKTLMRFYDNSTYVSLENGAIQVVKYKDGDYEVASIWRDKKKDAVSHYKYTTIDRMESAINKQVELVKSKIKYKTERKSRPKAEVNVGDIIYTSYGYDETHIDFFKVVGLVGKSTAEYVSIGHKIVESTSWCSEDVSPDPNNVTSGVQRGRIGIYGVKIDNIRGESSKTTVNSKHYTSFGYH